jgi:hypothetical protein
LKARGWIRSLRRGPTGIGKTAESGLGLGESNVPMPDFGSVELKSKRSRSTSPITLFTLNRIAWNPSSAVALQKYGYYDSKRNRTALYCVVTGNYNKQGLKLEIEDSDDIKIIDLEHNVVGSWNGVSVRDKVFEKIQAILLIHAESKTEEGTEYFWFKDAKILAGLDYRKFFDALKAGEAFIDIRMHLKSNGVVRNHGTGWRIKEEALLRLYSNVVELGE